MKYRVEVWLGWWQGWKPILGGECVEGKDEAYAVEAEYRKLMQEQCGECENTRVISESRGAK